MTALDGLKMVDLSRLLPGDYCSMLLADLGMDVLKVEEPIKGDYCRSMNPIQVKEGTKFLATNRNKRSISLNLKRAEGRKIFMELAEKADVVLESFRPGVARRLGVGYGDVAGLNPGIVYCSITGYGQTGPNRLKPGHDVNYVGLAGLFGLFSDRAYAHISPAPVADCAGGSIAALSILAAVIRRERTGKGQYIDVALTDGILSFLCEHVQALFGEGRLPSWDEFEWAGSYPHYAVYETSDGKHVAMANAEPVFWENFCRAIGREDLVGKQFARGRERELLRAEMDRIMKTRTRGEWEEFFETVNVCASPVLRLDETVDDAHFVQRGLFSEMDHPTEGRIRLLGFPARLSGTPATVRTRPPLLGEHTDATLVSLGYSREEIGDLREKGVI